jgi:hypothetical protein
MRHKVVALFYDQHQTTQILTGMESYYCFEEGVDAEYNERLRQLEVCSPEEASHRARWLSHRHQRTIHYGDFIHHRTHFCCLTTNSHIGLIKGDVFPDEPYPVAIQREIREETGLMVPLSRIISLDSVPFSHYRVSYFCIPLTSEEIQDILHYFEQRQRSHCGELFQLAFRHLPYVHEPMNHVTRLVSQWLHTHPSLPLLSDTAPIQFQPIPPGPPAVYYNTAPIIEPVFRRGVQRHSLLPL